MPLTRWQPTREIDELQKAMNRLFEGPIYTGERQGLPASFSPAVEMTEAEDAIHLKFEIPGMETKDLDIEVTPESVSISGERKSKTKTEEKGTTRTEFHYGKFHRVIPLPTRIQNNKVKAEYKDGILNVSLPKAEEEKYQVVKVKVN